MNVTKNAHLFFSRAPTHHSFTFDLYFLYELKRKFHLPKTLRGIFHFWSRLAFIEVYIFVKQKA